MARPASSTGRSSRKSRGKGGDDKSNAWLTTYADAITLLMAFFVLLYAMSEIDTIKFTAFLEGLRTPFGNEAGDGILPSTDGLQPEDTVPLPVNDPTSPVRIPELEQIGEEGAGDERSEQQPGADDEEREPTDLELREDFVEALQRRQAANDQLDVVAAALDEALADNELSLFVEMRREERGLVVSISSDDVLFALGSTDIGELGEQVIATVATTLDGFPNPLMVEGHTDNVPLDRGGYTNWNLSTDRAVAVLQLMIDDHELPPNRVGAVGYGEHHPLEPNASDDGRSRNRRVDIVVLIEQDTL